MTEPKASAWNWGGTDMTPRRTAPELSPAEAAKVAEFDAAPEPPEIVVERVARALQREWRMAGGWIMQDGAARRMARAAIAALDPS